MQLPLSAYRASQDDRLTRRDLRVYFCLFDCLDTVEYRYAKLSWLKARTHIAKSHISATIARLEHFGYIERGTDESPDQGGHPRKRYRLTLSPPIDGGELPGPVTSRSA